MNNLIEKKYWIWFSLIPNLGSIKKQELLKIYKNPERIFYLKENELFKVKGIGENTIKSILDKNIRNSIYKHIDYMSKNNIDIISITDKEYPNKLKQIYDFPISLYVKGNKECLNNKSIAIVGCRDCTEYGKSASKYFAYNLAKEKITIISGLAKGVDSYAHIGAICAQDANSDCGKTIAVVGNGLDIIYPKENEVVANQIVKTGGAIITEYPLGTKPERMNFPARNRIISGISNGVLVVEAKEKSGALITVDFALEQGRAVFVVPGNINSVYSVGTNELIKQGAKLVTNYQEILYK